jgi:putative peptidoglycan binding protein
MKQASIICAALLATLAACHTRTAADPSQEEKAARKTEQGDDDKGGHDEGTQSAGAKDEKSGGAAEHGREHEKASGTEGHSSTKSGSTEATHEKDEKDEKQGDHIDPEDIEVATAPEGLLKPGADEKVREKLGVTKGDGMRSALRKFQRDHDLPATGILDHESVIKLGLEPSDIFEQAK